MHKSLNFSLKQLIQIFGAISHENQQLFKYNAKSVIILEIHVYRIADAEESDTDIEEFRLPQPYTLWQIQDCTLEPANNEYK